MKDALQNTTLLERLLLEQYKNKGGGKLKIGTLFDEASPIAKEDPQTQLLLQTGAEEFMEETISSEEDIRGHVDAIAMRFSAARDAAVNNTSLYLSDRKRA